MWRNSLSSGSQSDESSTRGSDDASRVLMQLITGKIDKELIPIYKQELLKYAEKDTLSLVNLYNHLISVA